MNILYIIHPLNGLLMIGAGAGLALYLTHHFKLSWKLWWLGACTFVLSQVGHIPFNLFILNPLLSKHTPSLPEPWQLPVVAICLGLSAGLFEELTRYASYRWLARDARTWSRGLLFGAGHGGLEAVILGILVLYAYAQMVAIKDIDLSALVPVEQVSLLRSQIQLYWSLPWYAALLGAVERLFALPLHLTAALLVMQAFTRRRFRWVWLAVLLHTLTNALGVYIFETSGAYAAELTLGGLALFNLLIIFLLRQPDPTPLPEPNLAPLPSLEYPPIQEIPETTENLDASRYL